MWQHDGCFLKLKQSLCAITDDLIHSIFPRRNENNRNRAIQIVKVGSMQHSTLEHTNIASILDSELQIILFRISVTPSMKTKVRNEASESETDEFDENYAVCLEFEFLTKKLLCYPYSECGYCDGIHACSCIIGFLIFIRYVQNVILIETFLKRKCLKILLHFRVH